MIRSAAEDGRHALLIARDSPGVMFQLAPIYERRRQENSGNPLPQRGRVPTMDRTRRQQ